MKKSIFSFILAMVCVLSFMACSGGGKQTPVDNCKVDTDGDGTPNCDDRCPTDPEKTDPGDCGCNIADVDSDNDGVSNCLDNCDNSQDADGDGTSDCDDLCPLDANKTEPGVYGCGLSDTDTDNDGTPDFNDRCPTDPNKTNPGSCGCNISDVDTDGDSIPDCLDDCDNLKDTDGDGTPDCEEDCPTDPNKVEPGSCGCNISDVDTDGDSVPDCNDTCDDRIDSDGDGLSDCVDLVNNDGLTMETAKKIVDGMSNVPGKKAWYYFTAVEGIFYALESSVITGTEHDMNLLDSSGKYLSFNPDKSKFTDKVGSKIYNWKCPANGNYYIMIESDDESQEYSIDISESISRKLDINLLMLSLTQPELLYRYDIYEEDNTFYQGKGIAEGETQERTLNNATYSSGTRYDDDYIYFHVVTGVTYQFRADNVSDCNLLLYIHGREGTTLAAFNPLDSNSVLAEWTADRTDWILMDVKSWNIIFNAKYTLKITRVP